MMYGWLICVIWVATLLYTHHIGFEQGYKVGRTRECEEWLAERWKAKTPGKKEDT